MTETELAINAAVSAGKIIQSLRHSRLSVGIKESLRDVVTEVDVIAEKKIIEILTSKEKIAVISEELGSGQLLQQECWIVDPIDGTANFVAGNPNYCVSIGRLSKGRLSQGVVFVPTSKDLYYTHDGVSYKNKTRITANSMPLSESIIAFSLPGYQDEHLEIDRWRFLQRLNRESRGVLRMGSAALHLAWHAEGRFAGCVGFAAPLWDIAGGIALARSSGSCVFLFESSVPNRYDYICGGQKIEQEIRALGLYGFDFDSKVLM